MMTPVLLALLLQTPHPCDEPPPIVDTTRSPFSVTVCVSNMDADGNSPVTITSLQALIDGTVVGTLTDPVPVGPPSATGWSLYRMDGLRASRGARVLTFVAATVDGPSVPSDPFPFTAKGGPAAKPLHPRVEAR